MPSPRKQVSSAHEPPREHVENRPRVPAGLHAGDLRRSNDSAFASVHPRSSRLPDTYHTAATAVNRPSYATAGALTFAT
jgi:hypothetical protein